MPESAVTMSEHRMMFSDWLNGALDTAIGIIVGAIITLLTRASKSDVGKMERRIFDIEKESRSFVTKTELKEAVSEMKLEVRLGLEPIRETLAQIQQSMMDRK